MKFKPGNIIEHTPTKTKWIILSQKPFPRKNKAYKQVVQAYCIYLGTHRRAIKYWDVNGTDEFVLTKQDLAPLDTIWKIEHHEK